MYLNACKRILIRVQVVVCLFIPARAGTRVCAKIRVFSRIPGPEDMGRTRRTFRQSHLVFCHSIHQERRREKKEEVQAECADREKTVRERAPKRMRVPQQSVFLVQEHEVPGSMLQE